MQDVFLSVSITNYEKVDIGIQFFQSIYAVSGGWWVKNVVGLSFCMKVDGARICPVKAEIFDFSKTKDANR